MKLLTAKILAACCASLLLTGVTLDKSLAVTPQTQDSWDSVKTSSSVDGSCMSQIFAQAPNASATDVVSACTLTTTLKTKQEPVTSPLGGISTFAVAGAVRSLSWQLEKNGITYFEISKGKFYYDGAKAWSTKTYRNYTGSHACQAAGSWGVTVDVSVVDCTTEYSTSGFTVVDRETYKVSALFGGSPVFWVLAMSEMSQADGSTVGRDF